MRTEVVVCNAVGLARAAALLRAGELVAFPTETVYGLGARADQAEAVRKIFVAKGRPESRPLILHLASAEHAPAYVARWTAQAQALAQRFWPGPLTLVLERGPSIIDEVTAGGPTVALRVPAHPAALELLRACDFAVAAPSANLFGASPPRSGAEVLQGLGGRIAFVLDAGPIAEAVGGRPNGALGSTIVDLTCTPAKVLRYGALAATEIASVIELE